MIGSESAIRGLRPALISACVVAGLVLLIGGALLRTDHLHALKIAHEKASKDAALVAERVAFRLGQVRNAVSVLDDLPSSTLQSQDDFAHVTSHLLDLGGQGLALQWAPQAVVQFIHPLQGNEGAIGHDLRADPKRRATVDRLYASGLGHWAGPFQLKQGGLGLLYRLPVWGDVWPRSPDSVVGLAIGLLRFPEGLDAAVGQDPRIDIRVWLSAGEASPVQVWGGITASGEEPVVEGRVSRGFPQAAMFDAATLAARDDHLRIDVSVRPRGFASEVGAGALVTLAGIAAGLAILTYLLIRRREIHREIERESTHNQQLMQTASDGIHVLDVRGNVLQCSQAFADLLGYSRVEALRLNLRDWDATLDAGAITRSLQDAFSDDTVHRFETRHRRRDGSVFDVEVSTRRVLIGEQPVLYAAARDITQRKRDAQRLIDSRDRIERQARELSKANFELEQRAREAESANRTKSEFLSTMSHELRTPLNAVVGYAHLLDRSGLDAKRAPYVRQILASSQHLLAMISDVLDLSRIEAGQFVVTEDDFSLRELLGQVEAMLDVQAKAKGLALALELGQAGSRDLYRGDALRIRQCLINYAANAVKFTDAGRVLIRVEAAPRADSKVQLRFEVQDTGPGIRPEDQARLFAPFTQVDMSSVRQHGGAGLGLTITRRLALAMGGDAGLRSEPGKGSVFWFSVMVASVSVDAHADEASPDKVADRLCRQLAQARVLVIDDDPIGRGMLRVSLEKLGWLVDEANDAEQARVRAGSMVYDLLFVETMLPGTHGVELVTELRTLPGWSRVPIIAISADTRVENREQCLSVGADAFLNKPFDVNLLYATILDCVTRRATGQARACAQ